jgi:hypothetical protein
MGVFLFSFYFQLSFWQCNLGHLSFRIAMGLKPIAMFIYSTTLSVEASVFSIFFPIQSINPSIIIIGAFPSAIASGQAIRSYYTGVSHKAGTRFYP